MYEVMAFLALIFSSHFHLLFYFQNIWTFLLLYFPFTCHVIIVSPLLILKTLFTYLYQIDQINSLTELIKKTKTHVTQEWVVFPIKKHENSMWPFLVDWMNLWTSSSCDTNSHQFIAPFNYCLSELDIYPWISKQ